MVQIDLSGRVALVTGGARGIGVGITRVLAQAGATVAINFNESSGPAESLALEIEERGGQALPVQADVSDEEQVKDMVALTLDRFGQIDILVNNAGTTSVKPFTELDTGSWHHIVGVNLHGAFYCSAAIVPGMVGRGWGRVIHISSTGAITGGGGGAHYAASKGALGGLTRAMARELAPKGVLVNAIAPTVIASDFLLGRYPDPRDREALVKQIPAGRLGQPEDVGYLTAFLASDLAGFISGQILIVDGGRTFK